MCITFIDHFTQQQKTLFSGAQGTYTPIEHILGHKTNPDKFKRIEIIQNVFSDHIEVKLQN